MKRKNKVVLLVGIIIFSMLIIRITINNRNEIINDGSIFDVEYLLKFKSPYMGDASNTTQLFNALMFDEYNKTYQLYPEERSVEIKFSSRVNDIERSYFDKALIYNSTVAFSLLKNLKSIQYNFQNEIYVVTREMTESWYKFDLVNLYEDDNWKEGFLLRIENEDYIKKCVLQIINK